MTEVTSGGVPAENPFSLSQEESIAPDTPPRGEGNQETLAVKAKENGEVTISRKLVSEALLDNLFLRVVSSAENRCLVRTTPFARR